MPELYPIPIHFQQQLSTETLGLFEQHLYLTKSTLSHLKRARQAKKNKKLRLTKIKSEKASYGTLTQSAWARLHSQILRYHKSRLPLMYSILIRIPASEIESFLFGRRKMGHSTYPFGAFENLHYYKSLKTEILKWVMLLREKREKIFEIRHSHNRVQGYLRWRTLEKQQPYINTSLLTLKKFQKRRRIILRITIQRSTFNSTIDH